MNNRLPLSNLTIEDVFNRGDVVYEIPIYQRNYAWGKDEIDTFVQDINDAMRKGESAYYYIGTLATFYKGDRIYEVIDGQQRLTTIYLLLIALGVIPKNSLTWRARKKADNTIKSITELAITDKNISQLIMDEKDSGIVHGYTDIEAALKLIVAEKKEEFKTYLLNNVRLIHYQVPEDIDLNHFFEVMNSRGEQLEKHEYLKARLMNELKNDYDRLQFSDLWSSCSEMNVYIQRKYFKTNSKKAEALFGTCLDNILCVPLLDFYSFQQDGDNKTQNDTVNESEKPNPPTLNEFIFPQNPAETLEEDDSADTFQSVIDFPNFLLIVLKLTVLENPGLINNGRSPKTFMLDDKELIDEFKSVKLDETFVKQFGYNLLKARYLLDNYIVHHSSIEDEIAGKNPWQLQCLKKEGNKYPLHNLAGENIQSVLVNLLSMFEVTFTARQHKNYLLYCLKYLFDRVAEATLAGKHFSVNTQEYENFLLNLADKYFTAVYLGPQLNQSNTPSPGSFDDAILQSSTSDPSKIVLNVLQGTVASKQPLSFAAIYGDGTSASKGIPLFVFNYLDFRLWKKYFDTIRGNANDIQVREKFFNDLGCEAFDLSVFAGFYFSRTRRSLEHFFARANVKDDGSTPTYDQINCFGNYAMIGSEVNSSGSNWSPSTKLTHYLDSSGKIRLVSVASLKFMIMMQICKVNKQKKPNSPEWSYKDIKDHQQKMVDILL